MQILETFQQFSERKFKLFEQQSTGGFIVCFGCTDLNNVLGPVASKLGIEADFEFGGTISGAEGLDVIATKKSFADTLKKGKAVAKGKDFLEIKADGKTYTLDEKGSIQVPFTFGLKTTMNVRGSGNGLLALMRAIQFFKLATQNGFDGDSEFDGTLFIQIGLPVSDSARKGKYISVNAKYTETNRQRTGSDQYLLMMNRYGATRPKSEPKKVKEGIDVVKIQEVKQETPVNQILVTGDSIADAIKGAHFMNMKKPWKSKFGAYFGFNKMQDQEKKDGDWQFKDDFERATYYLAIALQTIINDLKYYYPLNNNKLFNVDLMPQCENILKAQGNDLSKFDVGSIKQQLTEIFKIFQPIEFPGFPEFKPKIPNYWSILTNAVVNRVLLNMPNTYKDAMTPNTESAGSATGGASSGGQNYGSGEF